MDLLHAILKCLKTGPLTHQKILSAICEETAAKAGQWNDADQTTLAEINSSTSEEFVLKFSNRNGSVLQLMYFGETEYDAAKEQLKPLLGLFDFIEEKIRLEATLRAFSEEGEKLAKRNSQLFEQLLANENRMSSISRGILRMQEEERAKISRDLHDGVGQALLAIKIHLDLIAKDPAATDDVINEARTLTQQTLEEVRHLSRLLRPTILDDLGLLPTLRSYVKSFTERTGIQISLTAGPEQQLDPEVETMLFRVTQEGLNNILKHSGAKNVSVKLLDTTPGILLEICDDGKGFIVDSSSELKGSGIQGMRDRVTLLGGKFTISSNLNQGTMLRIQLPVSKSETKRKVHRG